MLEFVEEDCGFVVPYLDLGAMVEKVILLIDSWDSRLKMGTAARRKIEQCHDIGGLHIMKIIERVVFFIGVARQFVRDLHVLAKQG
jgi:hypothetical protein